MTITDAAIRKAVMRWQKANLALADFTLSFKFDPTSPQAKKIGSERILATIYLQRIGNRLLIESARAKR